MSLLTKLFARRWILSLLFLVMAAVRVHAGAESTLPQIDLPACEASAPGLAQGVSIGLVQPYASEQVLNYAARLTLKQSNVNVCSETWASVLPRWVPWSGELERGHGFAAFVLAFVLAVSVLWFVTPREFWRRTTLLGVLGVGALTWVLGVVLLAGFHLMGGQRLIYGTVVSLHTPKQGNPVWLDVKGARELESMLAQLGLLSDATAQSVPPTQSNAASGVDDATKTDVGQAPSGTYRVYHRLNVREAAGTQSPWIATLNRGEDVQFDGATQGDWWRVRTRAGQVGWASSLWLRRPQEMPVGTTDPAKS